MAFLSGEFPSAMETSDERQAMGQERLGQHPSHTKAHQSCDGTELLALHDGAGARRGNSRCPRIAVDLQTIRFTYKSLRYVFLTPHVCQDNIIHFDQGERAKIRPFELKMRPAQISKAGKKRRQCPTDRELRGTGLTVAGEQPHLRDTPDPDIAKRQSLAETCPTASQRLTANGDRNLDPDRSDGLAPTVQEKRADQRKVSTAAKGSIPTTLGRKLPPVSILARREFGLRVLRK
jgi:hypothetical protein